MLVKNILRIFCVRSVRSKECKMVSLSSDSSWYLYRVQDDESELNDLAAKYPAQVKELNKKWQEWALQNHVLPKQKAR